MAAKEVVHYGNSILRKKCELIKNFDNLDNLIENIVSNSSNQNRMIFDGYPRNLNQTKKLDLLLNKYKQKIFLVISLNVEKEIVVKRILGRVVCSKCGSTFNKFFNSINLC